MNTDSDYPPLKELLEELDKENNKMGEEIEKAGYHPADTNGDGRVSTEEEKMYLEFKRKELEDQDAMRDAQRSMTWFALAGMLLYPATVMVTEMLNLHQAAEILGSMASVYFVSVAGIVAAFFGAQAWSGKK
jgi:hypothetical protein